MLVLALAAQAREQSGSHSDSGSRSESSSRSDSSSRGEAATAPRSMAQAASPAQDNLSRTRAMDVDALQQELLSRQKRRDVLREALRMQSDDGPAAARQMSLQERLELRQQLRQQQEWNK